PFGSFQRMKMGLLEFMQFERLNVLGYYDDTSPWGGTDRLAMNCHDDVEEFLKWASTEDERPIAFEGDRLCVARILKCCRAIGELRIISLIVSPETLAK